MSDFDPIVARELQVLVPPPRSLPNWRDVVDRVRPPFWRRPLVIALAATLALVVTGVAVAAALGGFDRWLEGKPGKPAAPSDQARFRAANGRTWAAFPVGTKLRELIDTTVGDRRYMLFGFRSGDELCLQLRAVALGHTLSPICTPASMLVHLGAPIAFGSPDTGLQDRYGHPDAEFSYGIAADDVRKVEVRATDGIHRATIGGNAYLWVENDPNTGNRVDRVTATTAAGRTTLPVPSFYSSGPSVAALARSLPGPTHVQSVIRNPTIGWYARHEPRGLSIDQARLTASQRQQLRDFDRGFTRLVKPDPYSNVVLGLTEGPCLIELRGAAAPSESCGALGPPAETSDMLGAPALYYGAAPDGVARVELFLQGGGREEAALRDNLYLAFVPASTAARIVFYDAAGRVVYVFVSSGSGRLPGLNPAFVGMRRVLATHGPYGATATMLAGRPAANLHCWQARFSTGRRQSGCAILQSGPWVFPASVQPAGGDLFVLGTYRSPAVRVRLRFADGSSVAAHARDGLFLVAVPRAHLSQTRQLAFVIGYEARGVVVQRQGVLFRQNP